MVGHDCRLPQLYLGGETVNLGQLFLKDGSPEGAEHNMRICRCTSLCMYVALKVSEQGAAPIDTDGDHIQAAAAIVLPVSTTMLVVQDVMGRQAPAQQFFFRGGHKWRFVITSGRDIFALRTQ